jgi:hypothetical protein
VEPRVVSQLLLLEICDLDLVTETVGWGVLPASQISAKGMLSRPSIDVTAGLATRYHIDPILVSGKVDLQ